MTGNTMVQAFAVLLACQLVGEGVAYATALPVPGPVIGLVLLAIGLAWRARRTGSDADEIGRTPLGRTADGLLGHLSLLFVPAAVGVVQQGAVLAANGWSVLVALALSTVLTLAATAAAFVWAARLVAREDGA